MLPQSRGCWPRLQTSLNALVPVLARPLDAFQAAVFGVPVLATIALVAAFYASTRNRRIIVTLAGALLLTPFVLRDAAQSMNPVGAFVAALIAAALIQLPLMLWAQQSVLSWVVAGLATSAAGSLRFSRTSASPTDRIGGLLAVVVAAALIYALYEAARRRRPAPPAAAAPSPDFVDDPLVGA